MILVTGFATVSQITNHCQISRCIKIFFTVELLIVTSQISVININDPRKH